MISDGTFTYAVGQNNGVFGLSDSSSTDEDNGVSINLFENAFDVEGDGYSVTSVDDSGTLGLVSVGADGIASYDPGNAFQYLGANESATDTFSYTVTDDAGNVSTQTVSVTISGVNDAPVVTGGDTSGDTSEDGVLVATGTVTASDIDTSDVLSWSGGGTSDYGSLSIDANGNWTYTLDNDSAAVQALSAGDVVSDEFTVAVSNGNGGTAEQTISVEVAGADDITGAGIDFDSGTNTILYQDNYSAYGVYHQDGYSLNYYHYDYDYYYGGASDGGVVDLDGDGNSEFGIVTDGTSYYSGVYGYLAKDDGGSFDLTGFDVVGDDGNGGYYSYSYLYIYSYNKNEYKYAYTYDDGIDSWQAYSYDYSTGQYLYDYDATHEEVADYFNDVTQLYIEVYSYSYDYYGYGSNNGIGIDNIEVA